MGSNPILPDQTALVVHRGAHRLKKAEGNGSIPVLGSISGSSPIGRGTRKKTYLDNGGVSQAALSTVLKTVGTVMSGMGLDTSLRRQKR